MLTKRPNKTIVFKKKEKKKKHINSVHEMDCPSVQGVFLPTVRNSGMGSSIPVT